MASTTISLCMIVKNEEKYLEACLQSVKNKVNEMIVVDTGSTDRTAEIAQSYGAKVVSFEWVDDFAAARNYALEQAAGEYALVLDADETLVPEANLQEITASGKDFYRMKIYNFLSEDRAILHDNVRLFRNDGRICYQGKLHENLNTLEQEAELTCENLGVLIHHFGYLTEVVEEKKKNERNKQIMAKALEENPNGFNLYNMGNCFFSEGNYREALSYFQKAYALSKGLSFSKTLLVHMALSLKNMERVEEALRLTIDAANVFPDYTEFYYLIGNLYLQLGYEKDAEAMFLKCLELGDPDDTVTNEGLGGYQSLFQLANLYEKQRRYEEAFDHCVSVLKQKRNYRPALILFFNLMQKLKISSEDVKAFLADISPIKEKQDVKNVLLSMYATRSPLLQDYVVMDKGSFASTELSAVALQYGGHFLDAKEKWQSTDRILEDNLVDILLLALLLGDADWLKQWESQLLNIEGYVGIRDLINRESVISELPTIENLLVRLCKFTLLLEQYELFDYLSSIILKEGSEETVVRLVELLMEMSFFEPAREVVASYSWTAQYDFVHFLEGKIHYAEGRYSEALKCFQSVQKIQNRMVLLEAKASVLEALNEGGGKKYLLGKHRSKFPLSIWLNPGLLTH